MMGLYLLGVITALAVAYVGRWFIHIKEKSFFILELPVYRSPRWKNIALTMVQKARIFVFEAGRVIMVISLILWALSSFGPTHKMEAVKSQYVQQLAKHPAQRKELSQQKKTGLL